MSQLVEFPLEGGGTILVATTQLAPDTTGVTRGGRAAGERVTEAAQTTFEAAIERVRPVTGALIERFRSLEHPPDEIHVEFGIDLHAELGAFIASANSTATFALGLTWRREENAAQ